MIINLSKIDFGGVATGGKTKPEEVFDVQPTTSDQTITPTEGSVFSGGTVHAVTAEIDANIVSNNIKEGVTILGVAGTLKEEKPEERFNVQPTTAEQTITQTAGSVFSGGTVHAVTSAIDGNIVPENIKQGVAILGVTGTLSGGSGGDTPDYRYANGTIDKEGLRAIGWTDEDILTYEQNKPPHYTWQNDQFKVSDENKALYLLDDPNPDSYKDNPNVEYVPKKNMESYFANSTFSDMKYIKGIPFYDNSKRTTMNGMFSKCSSLTIIPQLDTSKVTDMGHTFWGCSSLTIIPQLDTSKVTGMDHMFWECSSLTSIPQLNTSNATDMSSMFADCNKLTSIPQLNTSNVTNMSSMFSDCSSLTSIPQLDTSKVTDMGHTFSGCAKLRNIPQLNTSNVTNMSSMFSDCSSLTSIPQLNISNVTNMSSMFTRCSSLTSIPQLDTSKVTDMGNIFENCSSLTSISPLDFSNVTNADSVFEGCSSLTSIPPLNTSKVTSMRYMFNSCSSLSAIEGIDFSGLNSSPSYMLGFNSYNYKLTRFIVNGKLNVSISDNYTIRTLVKIDYDSVKSILEAANRTDNTNSKTLAFNRTIIDPEGELAALVAACSTKGWTITGLTLKSREDVILTCSDVVLTDGKVDYVPVTVDSINNWNTTRYNSDTVENKWLELGVYEGSKELLYNYSGPHWGDLTGQTAGINTAKLMVSDFSYATNNWGDLPEGIKFVLYFGISVLDNGHYEYEITLERINGQVTTTLHTISPYA